MLREYLRNLFVSMIPTRTTVWKARLGAEKYGLGVRFQAAFLAAGAPKKRTNQKL